MTTEHIEDLEPEDTDEVKGGGVNDELRRARNLVAKHGIRSDHLDRIVDNGSISEQ